MLKICRCAVVLALLAAQVSAVHAGPDALIDTPRRQRGARAKLLRQRALAHFVQHEYQLAADEFMQSYQIDERDETLYGWAEAVRATRDCQLAVRIYRRLIDKTTSLRLTRLAMYGISTCDQGIDFEPSSDPGLDEPTGLDASALGTAAPAVDVEVPETSGATERTGARPPAAPPPAEVDHTRSHVLVAGGSAVALIGLATYAAAPEGGGGPQATHDQVTAARSSGDWQRLIGASIGAVGVSALAWGVAGYLRDRPHTRPGAALAPDIRGDGVGLLLVGEY